MSQLAEFGKTPEAPSQALGPPPEQHPPRRRGGIVARVINRYNLRTGLIAGGVVVGALAVGSLIPGCEGGPVEETTQLGDLGGVLSRVEVPTSPIGIIEGDGTGTGEVIEAKFLHIPKLPLIGSVVNDVNGLMEKMYQTSATAKVPTSVEIVLASGSMTLKPYKLPVTAGVKPQGINGQGVEAVVKVGGLTSELVSKRPVKPDENSGEGIGSRVANIIYGNTDTTKTDNAAVYVAESYFQNVCGRAILSLGSVGVANYVQNIFRLDAQYFKALPGDNSTLDKELGELSHQPVRVVFTHEGKPVNPNTLVRYVDNFGPPLPDSKNIAKLVDNKPGNVIIPRQFDGCTSTTYAIKQQEKLIQQAALSTGGTTQGQG